MVAPSPMRFFGGLLLVTSLTVGLVACSKSSTKPGEMNPSEEMLRGTWEGAQVRIVASETTTTIVRWELADDSVARESVSVSSTSEPPLREGRGLGSWSATELQLMVTINAATDSSLVPARADTLTYAISGNTLTLRRPGGPLVLVRTSDGWGDRRHRGMRR